MDLISLKQLQDLYLEENCISGCSNDEKKEKLSKITMFYLIDRYVNPKQGNYGTGPKYSYNEGQPFIENQKDLIRTLRWNWGILTKSDSELIILWN